MAKSKRSKQNEQSEQEKKSEQGEQAQAPSAGEASKQEEPKIIVDDDWKSQAQAEKEKLAEQVEKGEPEAGEAAAEGQPAPRQIPPASFSALVTTLGTQIFLSLGGVEDPKTKQRYVDLDLAKHQIDILVVLEEKTAGNLTDQEKKLLDQVLYETRMQYVNVAQHATRVEPPKNAQ
ncbi:MAG: DUF1844 domain-containing protein [Planctomycetota bacterium]|jgi:hypothetical protein